MRLISLNTWGGIEYDPLMDFIKKQATTTDFFCFQEMLSTSSNIKTITKQHQVRVNLLEEIMKVLPGYDYFFTPSLVGFDIYDVHTAEDIKKVDFDLKYGLVIFYKKDLVITNKTFETIYQVDTNKFDLSIGNFSVILQNISIDINGKSLNLFNFHGAPSPGNKLDSDFRIKQSNKIKEYLLQAGGKNILVGDFNLMPNTKSIGMLDSLMRDLIKEFKVEKTRSKLNLINGKPGDQKYADYTFVSENIKIESFEVPDIAISDHLPMILQFS
ncbi:MAG: hypothetical protein Q7R49_05320 [Candidatus Daviesbacteria bacterium]|nr:hypothetical protein [Candidatus Daviesbacteria bacterium]